MLLPEQLEWNQYLIELRRRLIFCLFSVVIIFAILFYFANDLYHFIALPLLNNLPRGGKMIATTVQGPFWAPLKFTLVVSVSLAIPIIFYQLWSFIAPGLYRKERVLIWPLILVSTLLFYLGMVFAYFVVFPILFKFLTHMAPTGVIVMTDISHYLDFVLKLFFAFGVAFEVPVLVVVLMLSGIVSAVTFRKLRPYVIIAAFVMGMLLTPPDVISQCLLALPIWLLFEMGVIVGRIIQIRTLNKSSYRDAHE